MCCSALQCVAVIVAVCDFCVVNGDGQPCLQLLVLRVGPVAVSVLQCVVVCCNVLQCIAGSATHCITLHHIATHCDTLQHTATHCNTLQHTATHCNTLQHTATPYNTLQHTATHCNTLQHTATHCNTTYRSETSSTPTPIPCSPNALLGTLDFFTSFGNGSRPSFLLQNFSKVRSVVELHRHCSIMRTFANFPGNRSFPSFALAKFLRSQVCSPFL